jgi:hypothetical protein
MEKELDNKFDNRPHFAELKKKSKATQFEDSSPSIDVHKNKFTRTRPIFSAIDI